MKIKDIKLTIVQGDLTESDADAIVNAANSDFKMDSGLAGFIKMKGGLLIEEEALLQGPVDIGEAIVTESGHLKAKHVIHAVTMDGKIRPTQEDLRRACASALKLAQKMNLRAVDFPALGCGEGGFEPKGAAKIMLQEVIKAARVPGNPLREITFCLFDEKLYKLFKNTIEGYYHHLREDLGWGPYSTVDLIIEMDKGIVLIERSNPPYGWALPGGFLDYGESLEEAAAREAKEETSLDLMGLRQFHTYSKPGRDPRFQTITTVFLARGRGKPKAGDDAKAFKIVPFDELPKLTFAFDHKEIVMEYLDARR